MNDAWVPQSGPGTESTDESAEDVSSHKEKLRSSAETLREVKEDLGSELNTGSKAFLALTEGGGMEGFASSKALTTFAENWKTKTKALGKRCGYLASGIDGAAEHYGHVDDNNAVTINSTGTLTEVD